mmetsp:Transcript_39175/g.122551  ORF Transcript_39175/g.122551 Transcript_39175/m.122551 type:complete len:263 (+) Transcript_39175:3355-4143(+)
MLYMRYEEGVENLRESLVHGAELEGAINLHGMVRFLIHEDIQVLDLAVEPRGDVDAVIPREEHGKILDVHVSTVVLYPVIKAEGHFDVIYSGSRTDAGKGYPIEFMIPACHGSRVPYAHVLQDSRVVLWVIAAVRNAIDPRKSATTENGRPPADDDASPAPSEGYFVAFGHPVACGEGDGILSSPSCVNVAALLNDKRRRDAAIQARFRGFNRGTRLYGDAGAGGDKELAIHAILGSREHGEIGPCGKSCDGPGVAEVHALS